MGGMKSHLKLGALVVVLLAVAAVLVFTEGQRHRGTAPHDALHEQAEGEAEAEHQHEGVADQAREDQSGGQLGQVGVPPDGGAQ